MKIAPGDTAPDFTLQNTEGTPVSLSGLNAEGSVVLLFFPVAFSGTCTEELCLTRDNMKLYESLDARVAAISVDSFFALREYKKAYNLNFTLLSDFNREASRAYGVLDNDFYGMKGVARRASFVVDSGGRIAWAEVLEDADLLPDFEGLRGALQG